MTFEIGAILLVGAAVVFILQPLLSGREASLERTEDEPTEAEAVRRVKLLALRDVEYDYATGKLDEADYRSLKRELSAEALQALEGAEPDAGRPTDGDEVAVEVPAEVERAIARAREGLRTGLTCTTCGHVNPSGSSFCSSCGAELGAEASAG